MYLHSYMYVCLLENSYLTSVQTGVYTNNCMWRQFHTQQLDTNLRKNAEFNFLPEISLPGSLFSS